MRYIIHDVLQNSHFSYWQLEALKVKSMFDWFEETAELLKGESVTLSCLSEGLSDRRWVDFIKRGNFNISLHGKEHIIYAHLSYDGIIKELRRAKNDLECEFGCLIREFSPPKLKVSSVLEAACGALDLQMDYCRDNIRVFNERPNRREYYLHYWSQKDLEHLRCHLPVKDSIITSTSLRTL